MRPLLVSMIALLITGCTSPNSGVVPMGIDTYMIAKVNAFTSSGSVVKAELYREAGAFCDTRGKQLMPVKEVSQDSSPRSSAKAELQFRCLDSNDPELRRPTLQSEPDVNFDEE